MKLKLLRGTTSKLLRVFVQDSSQTDGRGLAALAFGTSGLAWYYIAEGAATATQVTLATMTVGTWATGGFKEVDAINMPGIYEIGVPNAALASGNSVAMMLRGAANMVPVPIEIELDAVNYQSATNFGLSALPTASPAASGGLPTVGTGSGQISPASGGVDVQTIKAQALTCAAPVTVGANVGTAQPINFNGTSTSAMVKADVEQINAQTVTAAGAVTVAANVGTATAALAVDASGRVDVGKILGTASAGAAGKVALDLAQTIPNSNTAQTVGDALNAARAQGFGKWTISGTTLTLYAGDGTTVVRSFTLDSATAPTQRV